ncbi:MAG: nucleoside recognition domain-containing protein [Enterobacteriaceae bacterium]
MHNSSPPAEQKVGLAAYIALLFAALFFSGIFRSESWYGVFDFTTLNGAFGQVVTSVTQDGAAAIKTTTSNFRGNGGHGALDGFLFAFGLIPAVMFSLGIINILEHYGALAAARKLLTPVLRPLMGVPGDTSLVLISSLQSTDVGASLTRKLADEDQLTAKEKDILTMFQYSAGATIGNFFSSGAILFTLMTVDNLPAVPASIGLCLVVMLMMKVFGANMLRLILTLSSRRQQQHNTVTQGGNHG